MSSDSEKAAATSFPFFSILGLIFITLKLIGEITWSWWWVLAPFWIPPTVAVVAFLVGFTIWLIVQGVKENKKKKARGLHKDGRRY